MNLSKLQKTWKTEKPGMLQSRGSQRAGHNWETDHQQQIMMGWHTPRPTTPSDVTPHPQDMTEALWTLIRKMETNPKNLGIIPSVVQKISSIIYSVRTVWTVPGSGIHATPANWKLQKSLTWMALLPCYECLTDVCTNSLAKFLKEQTASYHLLPMALIQWWPPNFIQLLAELMSLRASALKALCLLWLRDCFP